MRRAGGWDIKVTVDAMPEKVATAVAKLNELVGAEYAPIAYLGSQLVNGVNHAVLCEQTLITGRDTKNIVLVIFNEQPNTLDLTIVSIETVVEGGAACGGIDITVETDINETAKEIFDKSLGGFVGTVVEPFALLATQVVKGVNYFYAAESTPVIPEGKAYTKVVLVTINDTEGDVQFEDILA